MNTQVQAAYNRDWGSKQKLPSGVLTCNTANITAILQAFERLGQILRSRCCGCRQVRCYACHGPAVPAWQSNLNSTRRGKHVRRCLCWLEDSKICCCCCCCPESSECRWSTSLHGLPGATLSAGRAAVAAASLCWERCKPACILPTDTWVGTVPGSTVASQRCEQHRSV